MTDILTQLQELQAEIERYGTVYLNDQDTLEVIKAAKSHIASLQYRVLNSVRSTDPDTSREAQPEFKLNDNHWQLLGTYVRYGPLTADEAGEAAGMVATRACYWKRISELASIGYLTNTDNTRPGLAGKAQMVRTITNAGAEAYRRRHEQH